MLNFIPFGFAGDASELVSEIIVFYLIMLGIAVVRHAVIQALAALIPLNGRALDFRTNSWDRDGDGRRPGWPNDVELSAFTIAMLASSIQGASLLVLAPVAVGADSAISITLTVPSIRPAERSAGSLGKIKG